MYEYGIVKNRDDRLMNVVIKCTINKMSNSFRQWNYYEYLIQYRQQDKTVRRRWIEEINKCVHQ